MKNVLVVLSVIVFLVAVTTASAQQAPAAQGAQIIDIKLGKAVQDKQIAEESAVFAVGNKVYCWMKVAGASNDSLTVTWKLGTFTYTTKLGIAGNPYRTWTYKTAHKAGEWTVSVADAAGTALKELHFTVK